MCSFAHAALSPVVYVRVKCLWANLCEPLRSVRITALLRYYGFIWLPEKECAWSHFATRLWLEHPFNLSWISQVPDTAWLLHATLSDTGGSLLPLPEACVLSSLIAYGLDIHTLFNIFDGALSLQAFALRPTTSLSTLHSGRYLPACKTRYDACSNYVDLFYGVSQQHYSKLAMPSFAWRTYYDSTFS